MAKKKPPSSADVGFNMTPMIDCTFQLIIFFILASQVANESYAKNVKVHRPDESQSIPASVAEFPNKVTVNVISAGAGDNLADPMVAANAACYKIGTETYQMGEWQRMTDVIGNKRKEFLRARGLTPEAAAAAEAAAEKAGQEDHPAAFWLEIRADARVRYADVAPVIKAGVESGIAKMNFTALTNNQGGGPQ
jgi:biopolymer transport protein ExbD